MNCAFYGEVSIGDGGMYGGGVCLYGRIWRMHINRAIRDLLHRYPSSTID